MIIGIVNGVREVSSEEYGLTSFVDVGGLSLMASVPAVDLPKVGQLALFDVTRRGKANIITAWGWPSALTIVDSDGQIIPEGKRVEFPLVEGAISSDEWFTVSKQLVASNGRSRF